MAKKKKQGKRSRRFELHETQLLVLRFLDELTTQHSQERQDTPKARRFFTAPITALDLQFGEYRPDAPVIDATFTGRVKQGPEEESLLRTATRFEGTCSIFREPDQYWNVAEITVDFYDGDTEVLSCATHLHRDTKGRTFWYWG